MGDVGLTSLYRAMQVKASFLELGDRRIYTCIHEVDGDVSSEGRGLGVVLCPSEGHEYVRSHAALRGLADALTAAGLPALRLDYSGTGDSSGEASSATVERWPEEVAAAAQHLIGQTGVERVALVGLRLGALIAMRALEHLERPARLLLWHPPADGAGWLAELRARHAVWAQASFAELRPQASEELLGFDYDAAYASALSKLFPEAICELAADAAAFVVSPGSAPPAALLAAVGEVAGRVDVLDPPGTEFWAQKDDEYTTAFGPRKALRSICDWFTGAGEAT